MKYNRSEIMKAAWRNYRRYGVSFSEALRMAWYEAKKAVARYIVYGMRIHDDSVVLLLANATDNAAHNMTKIGLWVVKGRFCLGGAKTGKVSLGLD